VLSEDGVVEEVCERDGAGGERAMTLGPPIPSSPKDKIATRWSDAFI
jgi:hypothetical protein